MVGWMNSPPPNLPRSRGGIRTDLVKYLQYGKIYLAQSAHFCYDFTLSWGKLQPRGRSSAGERRGKPNSRTSIQLICRNGCGVSWPVTKSFLPHLSSPRTK